MSNDFDWDTTNIKIVCSATTGLLSSLKSARDNLSDDNITADTRLAAYDFLDFILKQCKLYGGIKSNISVTSIAIGKGLIYSDEINDIKDEDILSHHPAMKDKKESFDSADEFKDLLRNLFN